MTSSPKTQFQFRCFPEGKPDIGRRLLVFRQGIDTYGKHWQTWDIAFYGKLDADRRRRDFGPWLGHNRKTKLVTDVLEGITNWTYLD